MRKVNLRSYAVRNVLGFVRKHYGKLAVQAAGTHPTLLPWKGAHPDLKGMLTDARHAHPGHHLGDRQSSCRCRASTASSTTTGRSSEDSRTVFGPGSPFRRRPSPSTPKSRGTRPGPMPSACCRPTGESGGGRPRRRADAQFAGADEYTFYQANRFYRREPPSDAQPGCAAHRQNIPPPPKPPEYDFHRIVASYADYPMLLRALGLVIDCALRRIPHRPRAAGGGPARGLAVARAGRSNAHSPSRPRRAPPGTPTSSASPPAAHGRSRTRAAAAPMPTTAGLWRRTAACSISTRSIPTAPRSRRWASCSAHRTW